MNFVTKRLAFIPIFLITALMSFPILWLFLLTFKTNVEIFDHPLSLPAHISFDNYMNAFHKVNFLLFFKNSIIISIFAVFISLVISTLSSYSITRFKFKTKQITYIFFLMGLAIPVYVLMLPIYLLTNYLHIPDTYLSLILPYAASQISFNTLLFCGFLRGFPSELEDAAVIDGCGVLGVLWRIVVPIMKPVYATSIIFNFLGSWNEFPLASVLINTNEMKTISMAVFAFKGQYTTDYASMAAAVFIMVIPQLIFYVLFQRQIVDGMTAGAVKG